MTEKPPRVGWTESRGLVRLDLDGYAAWLPRLRGTRWPVWLRFLYVLFATETFGACLLYRLQTFFYGTRLGPVGHLLWHLNRILFSVSIGPDVRCGGGLHLGHGHVVLDGVTTLGRNVALTPFVTLGLSNASGAAFDLRGPVVGDDAHIGTGAKLLGPIRVGCRARIGANAVIVGDVPDDHTAAGVPARTWPSKTRHT